ncbi:hypothetical protein GGR16_002481 [Chelatococcus caeni]|uniref:Uncharacterized protein n=1 Tax=Chelatococcus caeni TaxID=1348468 RepID=A0A840C0F1_9HYPH|nr:hypothetical protein [Chelatococcus caeni]
MPSEPREPSGAPRLKLACCPTPKLFDEDDWNEP